MTIGKLYFEGRKVVGTIEGLHYNKSIWMAMTKEQRDKAVALHQAKSSQQMPKSATTLALTVPISKVSDKIDKLARTVISLDTNSVDCCKSMVLHVRFPLMQELLPTREFKSFVWL